MANGHPVKKFRLTKKVKEACQILEDNPITDLTPGTLEKLITHGKLDYQKIYDAMEDVGYRWHEQGQYWKRKVPRWLEALDRAETVKAIDEIRRQNRIRKEGINA
jgi:hypothetical protein